MGLSLSAAVAVAVGAVLGAWLRWLLSLLLNQSGATLPWGTLVANLGGGLLIGMALAWFDARPELPAAWRLFAITGFLGALTTFSSFSAESLMLLLRGQWAAAALHSLAHLLGSLAAAAIGFRVMR